MTPTKSTREEIIAACEQRTTPIVAERLAEADRRERAKWRPVYHYRPVFLVIAACVLQFKTFR